MKLQTTFDEVANLIRALDIVLETRDIYTDNQYLQWDALLRKLQIAYEPRRTREEAARPGCTFTGPEVKA